MPEEPLKARAGIPRLEASVAAPTVPDMRVVGPRLAFDGVGDVSQRCEVGIRREKGKRDGRMRWGESVPPTLNPAIASSGAPPKYFGETVWMP